MSKALIIRCPLCDTKSTATSTVADWMGQLWTGCDNCEIAINVDDNREEIEEAND